MSVFFLIPKNIKLTLIKILETLIVILKYFQKHHSFTYKLNNYYRKANHNKGD